MSDFLFLAAEHLDTLLGRQVILAQQDLPADNDLQKRLYDAFFNVWYGNPHLGGFMMWEWPPGPSEEKGYSPKGKPAEQVLKDWMAKKPWVVE